LLTPYVQNPDFEPKKIRQASVACEAMAMWAHAMHKFYHVNKQVEPLKIKLAEVEKELTIMRGQLESARARLKEVTD
jgi:dynein heavy chain